MKNLYAFQKDFAAAVGADDPEARPDGLSVDASWRFNVYRNNFFHGLIEQLKEAYPEVCRILGEDAFNTIARGFLIYHPPRTRSLALFGGEFPGYLAQISLTKDNALVCDMARLERAWLEALHAADEDILDPAGLAAIGENLTEARFAKHDAAAIVTSQIPLLDHWRVRRGGTPVQKGQNSGAGAQAALVTRPRLNVQIRLLTKTETTFGLQIFDGAPVSEAFDKAIDCDDAFDITEAFRTFLAAGAFAELNG